MLTATLCALTLAACGGGTNAAENISCRDIANSSAKTDTLYDRLAEDARSQGKSATRSRIDRLTTFYCRTNKPDDKPYKFVRLLIGGTPRA